MRILFRLIVLLLIIALAGAWLFLPKTISITSTRYLNGPSSRIMTFIDDERQWNKWWPGNPAGNPPFALNSYNYSLGRKSENIVEILVKKDDKRFAGNILFAGASTDTTTAQWTMPIYTGNNPIKRLRYYLDSRKLKADMDSILGSMNKFVSVTENIYGMKINRERVKDTVLVATRAIYNEYPSTEQIYSMVQKLKSYIASQNGVETNLPMLHVVRADKAYQTMVGIPTNHALKGNGAIELKRMVPGYILHGEVKGGTNAVLNGFQQLENYRYDKRLASPAIPFASLITDRSKEPDSTKWVTGLYYPVF